MSNTNNAIADSKSNSGADNAAAQEVNVVVGGDQRSNTVARNASGDCYGACYMCSRNPEYCAIARQHLSAPEFVNFAVR